MKTKLLLLLATLLLGASTVCAQSTAFTYQGRLSDKGMPANGVYDFQFNVFAQSSEDRPLTEAIDVEEVTVSNGLFTATLDFGDRVFNGANRWLEISVRLNRSGDEFTVLSPRQPITAVPYATHARNAAALTGTIATTNIAPGSITGAMLAGDAAAANLAANGQSAVAGGGVILSEDINAGSLANAGYVKIGRVDLADEAWQQRTAPPHDSQRRVSHTAVWTDREMIVWGGNAENASGPFLNSGDRFHGDELTWTPTATTGAPAPRAGHTALWTGSEMIIWGGYDSPSTTTPFQDGGLYNPTANIWTPIPTNGAPRARSFHTAVWTGSEMLVWGGRDATTARVNDGGRYNPVLNQWLSAINTNGAPVPREWHTAVWTGNEMIIWGGEDNATFYNDGKRYEPSSGLWTPIATASAPATRRSHTAVWTGSEMIVWGGYDSWTGGNRNDGGRYNRLSNTWTATTNAGAPAARNGHTAIWTGTEMIVWGGSDAGVFRNGGRYNPLSNGWMTINTNNVPDTRSSTAVWTGSEMLVWGGGVPGGRYDPALDMWLPRGTSGWPKPRASHTAVWTGSELIVWGGFNGDYLKLGSRYDPVANTWTSTTTSNAPDARRYHTAVWTGSRMIVWGGLGERGPLGTGGSYDPAVNSWYPVATHRAPAARYDHSAVWTRAHMIVWGGVGGVGDRLFNTGARYDPSADTWTDTATDGAPDIRSRHTAVWTGNEMIIWGGLDLSRPLDDGQRYDPVANSWTRMSAAETPARSLHTAIWTGSRMVVWGGIDGRDSALKSGASYNPITDTWLATSTSNAPPSRYRHSAVWTGSEMIVWSGSDGSPVNGGGRWNQRLNTWSPVSITGAPPASVSHTSSWTGDAMLVFGGDTGSGYSDSLFSYLPPRALYLYMKP